MASLKHPRLAALADRIRNPIAESDAVEWASLPEAVQRAVDKGIESAKDRPLVHHGEFAQYAEEGPVKRGLVSAAGRVLAPARWIFSRLVRGGWGH